MLHTKQQILGMVLLVFLSIGMPGCKKYLDEKPDKKLVIPSTLADLQALLDYNNIIIVNDPTADEASADNYYLPSATWQALPDYEHNLYTWQRQAVFHATSNDWAYLYAKVYYANTALEQLGNIPRHEGNAADWDNIRGQALMVRGKAFLQAALIWCKAYDAATANADMGVPLRLHTDFAETAVRASLQQTYDRILADLREAAELLPAWGTHVTRPSKVAAFGYLSRTLLAMRDYNRCGMYADSALQINNSLLNFSTLNASATYPIPKFNTEILYYNLAYAEALDLNKALVDTVLAASYASNDLRRSVFFRLNANGTKSFKGSYVGNTGHFTGVAVDEMYLNRAECFARSGNTLAAMNDLNTLLRTRFAANTYMDQVAANSQAALETILAERRKELLFRGVRWMDIKRMNKEGANISLVRKIGTEIWTLAANSNGFALPIPEKVIENSGMPQNPE